MCDHHRRIPLSTIEALPKSSATAILDRPLEKPQRPIVEPMKRVFGIDGKKPIPSVRPEASKPPTPPVKQPNPEDFKGTPLSGNRGAQSVINSLQKSDQGKPGEPVKLTELAKPAMNPALAQELAKIEQETDPVRIRSLKNDLVSKMIGGRLPWDPELVAKLERK